MRFSIIVVLFILSLTPCTASIASASSELTGGDSGLSAEEITKFRLLLKDPTIQAHLAANNKISTVAAAKEVWVCPIQNLEKKVAEDHATYFLNLVKHTGNCYILQGVLLANTAFYVAVFVVLQFHMRWWFSKSIREWVEERHSPFLKGLKLDHPSLSFKKLAVNVIVLNLWFNGNFVYASSGHRHCLLNTVYLFLFERYILNFLFFMITHLAFKSRDPPESEQQVRLLQTASSGALQRSQAFTLKVEDVVDPTDDTDDAGYVEDTSEARNRYEDLTVKFRRVCILFGCQLVLVTVYLEQMVQGGDDKNLIEADSDLSTIDVWYWFAAVALQLLKGDAEMGSDFNWKYWAKLILNIQYWKEQGLTNDHSTAKQALRLIGERHKVRFCIGGCSAWIYLNKVWRTRALMDFCINGLGRGIILATFPIMLCVEGPLDFAKDCTAVLFITTLDDLEDGSCKSCKEMSAKLKLRYLAKTKRNNGGPEEPSSSAIEVSEREAAFVVDPKNEEKFEKVKDFTDATDWKKWILDKAPQPEAGSFRPPPPDEGSVRRRTARESTATENPPAARTSSSPSM